MHTIARDVRAGLLEEIEFKRRCLILQYQLPGDQEGFNDALHGPAYVAILRGLILRLARMAYPSGLSLHIKSYRCAETA
jgi:hypothetical protein